MWFWLLTLALWQTPPAAGKVVDPVLCRDDPAYSYALYLPPDYRPGRRWPLLIALDPGARGSVPVQRFETGARRLGYIVVGSNQSRNGPLEPSARAVGAIWKDVSRRFWIDAGRVYLTGFSGGARMALQLARGSVVSGVIGCGAGLLQPGIEKLPFAFAGIAGETGMNHLEVQVLTRNLKQLGTRARFFSFQGGHQWPPPAVCSRALQWLDRLAAAAGKKTIPLPTLGATFEEELSSALEARESGFCLESARKLENLIDDFRPFLDVSQPQRLLTKLRSSRCYRHRQQRQQKRRKLERRWIRNLLAEMLRERPSHDQRWWRRQVTRIRRLQEGHPERRKLVSRLFDFIWRNGIEKSWWAASRHDFQRAASLARIALQVRPHSSGLLLQLARVYSLQGKRQEALATLTEALLRGAKRERIRSDNAFSGLQNMEAFQKLLAVPH